ncbi:MAG TPA: hypothetical protein VMW93_07945 [bacterium]|nr:hypothetical protein [bacterium]
MGTEDNIEEVRAVLRELQGNTATAVSISYDDWLGPEKQRRLLLDYLAQLQRDVVQAYKCLLVHEAEPAQPQPAPAEVAGEPALTP